MAIDPVTQYILLEQENISELTDSEISRLLRTGVKVAILLAFIYATYKAKKKKGEEACKNYKGEEKTKCLKLQKSTALQHQLKAARQAKSLCSKAKNPQKCAKRITAEIGKIEQKIKKFKK